MGESAAIFVFVAATGAFFLAIGLSEGAIRRILERRRLQRLDKILKDNEKKTPE